MPNPHCGRERELDETAGRMGVCLCRLLSAGVSVAVARHKLGGLAVRDQKSAEGASWFEAELSAHEILGRELVLRNEA